MECKLDFTCENIAEKGELIDTLWNVNSVLPHGIPFCCICELIDTLWNVNFIYGISVISINCELIDTLWNVNI